MTTANVISVDYDEEKHSVLFNLDNGKSIQYDTTANAIHPVRIIDTPSDTFENEEDDGKEE